MFFPQTKFVFSSLNIQKDKKNIEKEVLDANIRLKNFFNQKNTDYNNNANIKEDHQGNKKLHLNKRGKSLFTQNLFRYLICNKNIKKMLNLTVSRKVMMNIKLKKIWKIIERKTFEIFL